MVDIKYAIETELRRQAEAHGATFESPGNDWVVFNGRRIDLRMLAATAQRAANEEFLARFRRMLLP